MAAAVIEGRVLSVDFRQGVKEGRPWSMNTANILVADTDVSEIQYDPEHGAIRKDDLIRVVCKVSTYRGEPSFRAVGPMEVYDNGLATAGK